jgi:hypothetical protein
MDAMGRQLEADRQKKEDGSGVESPKPLYLNERDGAGSIFVLLQVLRPIHKALSANLHALKPFLPEQMGGIVGASK